MNTSTENSTESLTEGLLEAPAEKSPVSVYSVNFTPIINDAEREFLMQGSRLKNSEKTNNRSGFSNLLFRWRSGIAIAAILVVGILHFGFQISFIRSEKGETERVAEIPAKVEQLHEQTVEPQPDKFEVKKTDDVITPKLPAPARSRQTEILPVRPQLKKKEAVETRADRLRRTEKILTGV